MTISNSGLDDNLHDLFGAPPAAAAQAATANPDAAARALDLSKASGAPPPFIQADPTFDKQFKASAAAGIVRNNPQLGDYVASHPLAAAVSNDDWGNLDRLSASAAESGSWLHGLQKGLGAPLAPLHGGLVGAAEGAAQGFAEGLGAEPFGAWLPNAGDPAQRLKWSLEATAWAPFELLARTFSGLLNVPFGLARGAGAGVATGLGAGPSEAENVGRQVQGIVESELGRGEVAPEISARDAFALRANEALAAAKPWIENGLEPPTGLHPLIDAAKADVNSAALRKLETDLANAQASSTRPRAPDMFRNFLQQHYGNATIGIGGDAAVGLYGGKAPAPGDGLLGFVPDIQRQLLLSAATGSDVHVPVADWIGKVDPAVADTLRPDIRVWPGGVTAREAMEVVPARSFVDSPLAQVRGAAGLEPMFSVGDRKLWLAKATIPEALRWAPEGLEVHTFNILDEGGRRVGDLELSPDPAAKSLYIHMINGSAGMWANSFGPSLIRDLKAQLKALYPGYESITGFRVSGAHEEHFAPVSVRLDAPETPETFDKTRQILSGAWYRVTPDVFTNIRHTPIYSNEEASIRNAVEDEVRRMAGDRAQVVGAEAIYHRGLKQYPQGMFMQFRDRAPMIVYDLFAPDAVGIARHEAIHYLYREGFFTGPEWQTLTTAAEREGWIGRYDIGGRYPHLGRGAQLEEAIADGYREWAKAKDEGRISGGPISAIFNRMQELWNAIRLRLAAILGHEPTFQDLFEKVHSGEVGQRPLGAPLAEGAFREPAFSLDEQFDSLRASALGLDLRSYQRLQAAVRARYEADIAAATERARREQQREQTATWRENRAEMRRVVEASIRQRPDIAADLFVGSGELFGNKLRQRYPLRADDLTPEQKALLPAHYYAGNGLPLDGVSRMFGFQSGDQLVRAIADYNSLKDGRTPQEMLRYAIDQETDRQMQARYGNLDENVMDAARDQALSETDVNLFAQEMYAAGLRAGLPTVDKDVAQAAVRAEFEQLPIGGIDSQRLLAQVAKQSRDIERSLIAGDNVTAIQGMQRKLYTMMLAAEARKAEREVAAFNKVAKQMSKVVPGVDGEYMNYIHQILGQVGKPVRRELRDILKDIEARNAKGLEAFVQEKFELLRELPVWPTLYDGSWKKDFDSLSVGEFRAIRDSVKALAWNGRDELKLNKQGEAFDKRTIIDEQMIPALGDFRAKRYDAKGNYKGPIPAPLHGALRSLVASNIVLETTLNRWDKFDPFGPFNQFIMRPLIDGGDRSINKQREFATKIRGLADGVNLKAGVENELFRAPIGNRAPLDLNRGNLRVILLNSGSASNLDKLARGYHVEPAEVAAWLNRHATKEDWDWAQKVWDMFAELKEQSDTMYRSLTGGVAPGSIDVRPITTPFGVYRGGYYPVIWHPEFKGKSPKLMGPDALVEDWFESSMTPAGYTKPRTGYAAPLSLELDMMPNRIKQIIHDIELRPALIEANKFFRDPKLRDAIMGHYGKEYRNALIPYLRDVANATNYIESNQQKLMDMSQFMRNNMVSSLIGFNPSTPLKHGPTALVLSMREVGPINFLNAVRSMWMVNEATGELNKDFAFRNSQELQRRWGREWEETLFGATKSVYDPSAIVKATEKMKEWASKPVALSDFLSATPTWLATYRKAMDLGHNFGDSIYLADRAVRRAHGSSARTNQPPWLRSFNKNPIGVWLTPYSTTFINLFQRQAETVWQAGDRLGLTSAKEMPKATVAAMAATAFAAVIWPAIIEEIVSPSENKNQSWEDKAARGLAHTLSASWPIVRDLVNGWIEGKDPDVGVLSDAYRGAEGVWKDLFDKKNPLSRQHAGKVIRDAVEFGSLFTGAPVAIGKAGQFAQGVAARHEQPRGPWGWLTGLRYGTLKHHSRTFADWMEGR